jgi:hypothetical protein
MEETVGIYTSSEDQVLESMLSMIEQATFY